MRQGYRAEIDRSDVVQIFYRSFGQTAEREVQFGFYDEINSERFTRIIIGIDIDQNVISARFGGAVHGNGNILLGNAVTIRIVFEYLPVADIAFGL